MPDDLVAVPDDDLPVDLVAVPADDMPDEYAAPARDPYEPLGPPLPEAGGHRGPPRRVSKPSPRSLPVDALAAAFDPYGTSIDETTGRPMFPLVKAPDDYSTTVGESLVESLGEDFKAPSGADWWENLRTTAGRWLQGYKLKQLEDLEDEILGRTYDFRGEAHYSQSPERLRELQSDPLLLEVRNQIEEAKATGLAISEEQQNLAQRNNNYWSSV